MWVIPLFWFFSYVHNFSAIYLLWRKGISMLPHLHHLSQNLHYDFFFLINQERFQGNVLFNQIFKEFSYSSNGWVITCDYLWLSKSLTQNPVYWSTIEPAWIFILIKWLGDYLWLPVIIKVIDSKSGLLINNRTCLPVQETEEISSFPGSGRSPGEGNGYPLQFSFLETPMDRGAWRATVHGFAKSQTGLSDWTCTQLYRQGYHPDCSKDVCEGFLSDGWAFLVAQLVKNPPAVWETWVCSLGWEDPPAKGKAAHSSIQAWRIPWTVQSMGSQRLGHDWAPFTSLLLQSGWLTMLSPVFVTSFQMASESQVSVTALESQLHHVPPHILNT